MNGKRTMCFLPHSHHQAKSPKTTLPPSINANQDANTNHSLFHNVQPNGNTATGLMPEGITG